MDKETFFSVFQNEDVMNLIKGFASDNRPMVTIDQYKNGDMAAYHGYLNLIKEKPDLTFTEEAINLAAEQGHLNVVEYLIDKSHVPTSKTLVAAAFSGKIEFVQYLLDLGVVAEEDSLERAAESGNLDMVKYIHNLGFDYTEDVVKAAIRSGNLDIVEYFVGYLDFSDIETYSEIAAENGHSDILEYFISIGYDLSDFTLDSAIEKNQVDTVEFLVSILFPGTEDTMMTAVKVGNMEVINMLVDSGNYRITEQAFAIAGEMDRREVLGLFMQHKPEFLQYGVELALQNGNTDTLRYLTDLGYDITSVDLGDGLFYAIDAQQVDAIAYLLSLGYELDEEEIEAIRDTPDLIERLVEMGYRI